MPHEVPVLNELRSKEGIPLEISRNVDNDFGESE